MIILVITRSDPTHETEPRFDSKWLTSVSSMTPKLYAIPSRTKLQAKQAKQITQPQPPSGGPGSSSTRLWVWRASPPNDTPLSALSDGTLKWTTKGNKWIKVGYTICKLFRTFFQNTFTLFQSPRRKYLKNSLYRFKKWNTAFTLFLLTETLKVKFFIKVLTIVGLKWSWRARRSENQVRLF